MAEREPELRLLTLLAAGRTFVDVGANRGTYSYCALAAGATQVIAAEPIPELAADLRRTLGGRAVVHEIATSAEEGSGVLRVPTLGGVDRLTRASLHGEEGSDGRRIDVVTLPLDQLSIPHDSVIKIDVEGHEIEVLNGAAGLLASGAPAALLVESEERHSDGGPARLINLMQGWNYTGWAVRSDSLVPVDRFDAGLHQSVEDVTAIESGEKRPPTYANNFCFVRDELVDGFLDGLDSVQFSLLRPSNARDEQVGSEGCGRNRSTETLVVYTGSMEHRYVRRVAQILTEAFDRLEFRDAAGTASEMAKSEEIRMFHLQWIDVVLRRKSLRVATVHASKLLGLLVLLRLRRVPIAWTIHNVAGKAHSRVLADRALRTILVLLSNRVILLTDSAAQVRSELFWGARRRFDDLVSIVPMPMFGLVHGPRMEKERARAKLGIEADVPLLAYFAGANQPDLSAALVDADGRYELMWQDTDAEARDSLVRSDAGWCFHGRPDDRTYGLLLNAADAVVLADGHALGSMTLHAAVEYRRPVISPACPAVSELAELGGAFVFDGGATAEKVALVLGAVIAGGYEPAWLAFEERHGDAVVAEKAAAAYRAAGLSL